MSLTREAARPDGVTSRLFLDADERAQVWAKALAAIDEQAEKVRSWPILPTLGDEAIRALVASVDFDQPVSADDAVDLVTRGLQGGQVHTAHPRYLGLYNPPASTLGAVADALVAAYNPNLAGRLHAPFAVEVEQRMIRAVATKLGFDAGKVEGTFTTGGAEANATALVCALAAAFPSWATQGLRSLPRAPTILASREAHHSLEKAARAAGLGDRAVRRVATDDARRMDLRALAEAIAQEKGEGRAPFLVVATCGSTSAGSIDDAAAIAELTVREGLWLHVDAAWGGLAALVPDIFAAIPGVAGIPRADSVTFDAHKALAVPMAAGMYISGRTGTLARAFAVHSQYMPKGDDDPYARSVQWSRRFAGLKLFLTLAVAGWSAYEDAWRGQIARGEQLRRELAQAGWVIKNDSPLPVVCFVDGSREDGATARHLAAIARAVSAVGWISATRWSKDEHVLRACITNPLTRSEDVSAVVLALDEARARLATVQ
jgi:glutamate/tyrosine decarboxylase-like PLP-dependent enzyme